MVEAYGEGLVDLVGGLLPVAQRPSAERDRRDGGACEDRDTRKTPVVCPSIKLGACYQPSFSLISLQVIFEALADAHRSWER